MLKHAEIYNLIHGKNKADRKEVNCTKGTPEAAGCSKSGPQECSHLLRTQEAPPLQTRYGSFARNPQVPEERKG